MVGTSPPRPNNKIKFLDRMQVRTFPTLGDESVDLKSWQLLWPSSMVSTAQKEPSFDMASAKGVSRNSRSRPEHYRTMGEGF